MNFVTLGPRKLMMVAGLPRFEPFFDSLGSERPRSNRRNFKGRWKYWLPLPFLAVKRHVPADFGQRPNERHGPRSRGPRNKTNMETAMKNYIRNVAAALISATALYSPT